MENIPSLWFTKMKLQAKIKKRFHGVSKEITEDQWKVEDDREEKKVTEVKEATEVTEVISKEPVNVKKDKQIRPISMEEAMMWSEILGEPVCKKRRRKRMEQRYGNQGYADRG